MTRLISNKNKGVGLRPLPKILLAAVLAAPLAACDTDELVQVENPTELSPEDLQGVDAVPALVAGAFRQFGAGYSGLGDDAFLSASAVLTDEFYYGDTFTTRDAADKRTLQPPVLGNISDAAFSRLQQARLNARRGYALIEQFTTSQTAATDRPAQVQLRAIEGFTYVTFSEGWCGAVPISRISDTGAIDPTQIQFGNPLTTAQLNDTAVARFNDALAVSGVATTNTARYLAAVGKARALLNLGRYAEAATTVSAVPTSFVFRIEHSSNAGTQNNPMFQLLGNGRYGVANLEGASTTAAGTTALRPDTSSATTAPNAEGVAFRGLQDPRVPYRLRGTTTANSGCFSASVRCYLNNNYRDNDADVPLASGVEARLVEAEAALQAGNAALMLTRLNDLRASAATLIAGLYNGQNQVFPAGGGTPTLAPLTDPATAAMTPDQQFAARRQLLFQERALWLYNTGHRQGDLRRLSRPTAQGGYGLATNQVFPSGPHFRGGTYGNDVAYPVPFAEAGNNPNFNASQCVTTQP